MSHEINTLIAEDRQYSKWERDLKNKILSMQNPERKQEMWDHYFPKFEHNDDYLEGEIF